MDLSVRPLFLSFRCLHTIICTNFYKVVCVIELERLGMITQDIYSSNPVLNLEPKPGKQCVKCFLPLRFLQCALHFLIFLSFDLCNIGSLMISIVFLSSSHGHFILFPAISASSFTASLGILALSSRFSTCRGGTSTTHFCAHCKASKPSTGIGN